MFDPTELDPTGLDPTAAGSAAKNDAAPARHLHLVPMSVADQQAQADHHLTAELYAGPYGDLQRQGESDMYAEYANADAAGRVILRTKDHPTDHFTIQTNGVMCDKVTAIGRVRVAPWPPTAGELGFGLGARGVTVDDNVEAIEDARWSLRIAAAPQGVQDRALAKALGYR